MRIFVAVRHSTDPKRFYGALWSANFYPALESLGHEVIQSQVDLLPASTFMSEPDNFTPQELEVRARLTQQIVEEVRAAHAAKPIDLFLSYFYNSHFDPAGFDELRALGIPSVNYYCNSIYQFPLVAAIAAKADFSWHAERDARASYLSVGAKPVWVQMGADARVYAPAVGLERAAAACFVGQRYADRDRWMAALLDAEVPVDIYGPSWGAARETAAASPAQTPAPASEWLGRPQTQAGSRASYLEAMRQTLRNEGLGKGLSRLLRQFDYRRKTRALAPRFYPYAKGAIPFEKIAGVFSSYEVCLNFSNVWADGRPGSALIPHVRLRDFEAPMCRTCYLTGYTEEIEEFYEIGREIDTYRSAAELVEKTRFYLAHPAAAEALREAGFRRARRDHTWAKRFETLFEKIGLGHGR